MCPTPVLSEFLNRLRRRRGILAEKTVNVFTVTTPSDYIYIHNVLEGLQGPWGKRKGSNMLHSSPNHTPLSSAGSHASTHSLAGFQVGRSRKDLHKEELKDSSFQIKGCLTQIAQRSNDE